MRYLGTIQTIRAGGHKFFRLAVAHDNTAGMFGAASFARPYLIAWVGDFRTIAEASAGRKKLDPKLEFLKIAPGDVFWLK